MKEYVQVIGGLEHTVLLDEDDAKRLGLAEVKPGSKEKAPANKARSASNK